MGYNLERRTALLKLHDDYEGVELRVRRDVPLKVRFELVRLYNQLTMSQEDAQGLEGIVALEQIYGYFCEHYLLEWNLEEDDKSLAPTLEGFLTLPPELATAVVQATLELGNEVSNPLAGSSGNGSIPEDGKTLPEQSITGLLQS